MSQFTPKAWLLHSLRLTSLIGLFFLMVNASADYSLRLATTTSTHNSGLLNVIMPTFEKMTGIKVSIVSVGTGKALKLGCDGDVDAVLVHAKSAEEEFVQKGCGVKRHPLMANQFIIIGPNSDPAQISDVKSIKEALNRIHASKSRFVSRGDKSGTHKKELYLWEKAGIDIDTRNDKNWYIETGSGMGKVIIMADELDAYTLSDSGTWLAFKHKTRLKKLYFNDKSLENIYSIIGVNPEMHSHTKYSGVQSLIRWFQSKETQKAIGKFKVNKEVLFKPLVHKQASGQRRYQ